ncbi:MAG: LPS export ABC transporter permease LptF [Desulfurivibrionaceae bacterium]
MPILLYTYLAAEILGPFFASLLIINAILFLGKLSSLLDVIFGFGIGIADFGRISVYLLPNLMLFSIPMASTLGVIVAFTRMTGDNEMLALKASGVSLYRILVPVVIVACFTTGLTALTSSLLIPKGSIALKQTFFQLAREKIEQGVQAREFSDNIKDVVVYVDRIDRESGRWQGVFISDHRDQDNPLTIISKSGSLEADLDEMTVGLILRNGSIHRDGAEASQIIRFDRYNLTLPVTSEAPTREWDKKDMSPRALLVKVKELKSEAAKDPHRQPELSKMATGLLIEFHQRFALPAGCLILTILALPLALQSKPGRSKVGLPLGLFFFFIYYILLTFAKSAAETAGLPIWPIMWSPNLIFAVLTLLIIRIAARENSVRIFDKAVDHLTRLGEFLKQTLAKLIK